MKLFKNIILLSIVLMSTCALAQDFTPYYFDTDYKEYSRTSSTNIVEGDFSYTFSEKLKKNVSMYFYSTIIHVSITEDNTYCIVHNDANDIVIRYFDKDMNQIAFYPIEAPKKDEKRNIKTFVKNDTIFNITVFKNKVHDKVYIFCETFSINDGTSNNDLRKIAESNFKVDEVEIWNFNYFMEKNNFYASENNKYYAILLEKESLCLASGYAANEIEYFLFDENLDLVQHKDTLINPNELFDKFESFYTKDFWTEINKQLWMQDIELDDKGNLSFLCTAGSIYRDNEVFSFKYITNNAERNVPIRYCFVRVNNDKQNPDNKILIDLGNEKSIQDINYKILENDSILFTTFYRTTDDYPHNIASLKCSLNDDIADIYSDFHLGKSIRRQYATQQEKEFMIDYHDNNRYYYSNVYECEEFIDYQDGYLSIYNAYMTYAEYNDGMTTTEAIYTMDYYFVYHSKDGEIIDVYKVPQRKVDNKYSPNLLYKIIDDEMYIVFADGRLHYKGNLFTNYNDIKKRRIKYTQFVVYKLDKDFNITQYTLPIDEEDFPIVSFVKDFWVSDTEVIGVGSKMVQLFPKLIRLDISKIVNE